MTTALFPALAVAFAAFCVWLVLRIVNRWERWAKWTLAAVVAALPVALIFKGELEIRETRRKSDGELERLAKKLKDADPRNKQSTLESP